MGPQKTADDYCHNRRYSDDVKDTRRHNHRVISDQCPLIEVALALLDHQCLPEGSHEDARERDRYYELVQEIGNEFQYS